MFDQLSVKIRLTLLGLLPLVALVAVTLVSLVEMQKLNQGIDSIYQDRVQPLQQIKVVSDNYAVDVVDLLHKQRAGLISAAEAQQQIRAALTLASTTWQTYLQTELTAEERRLINQSQSLQQPFLAEVNVFLGLLANNQLQAMPADEFNRRLYGVADPFSRSLNDLIELQLRESRSFRDHSQASYQRFESIFIAALAVLVLGLAGLGWLIYQSVNRPLQALSAGLDRLGNQLDLRQQLQVKGNNELSQASQAFNKSMAGIRALVANIAQATEQVATAAEEMNQISSQVTHSVLEQQQQSELISSAITEMSASTVEVANSAQHSSDQAREAKGFALEGVDKVKANIKALEKLSQSMKTSSDIIATLNADSDKISQVLAVIGNIAEQTNLLALNAAIEAARAGDAGRGFAVVADEVRTLATNTQKATGSIKEMIERLHHSARQAVSAVEASSQEAQQSKTLASESGHSIDHIQQAVERVNDSNSQISAATVEQSQAAEEISENVRHFAQSISDIAESAGQNKEASAMLAQLASDLQNQVVQFKV